MTPTDKEVQDNGILREIAREISEYRKEAMGKFMGDVVNEANEVASSGYDPARGRGRGPTWADGD